MLFSALATIYNTFVPAGKQLSFLTPDCSYLIQTVCVENKYASLEYTVLSLELLRLRRFG